MATKRKAAAMAAAEDDDPIDPSDELVFIGLGGCQEVGRSCHILQYKGKTIMLDAGMHTGREGMSAMPYFDDFDLSTVDILLISQYVDPFLKSLGVPHLYTEFMAQSGEENERQSHMDTASRVMRSPCLQPDEASDAWENDFVFVANHQYNFVHRSAPIVMILSHLAVLRVVSFHLDHAAALPYVLAKTDFKGRVFMTHPTKAIYKWLIQDSVRVSNTSSTSDQRTSLYTEQDHISTLPQIETIDFYTTHTISGVRVTPYPAGHVLGAAMFLINIAGLNIFFTGDYSREPDRHLVAAARPQNVGTIDLLITESTFGISNAPPRSERETALLKSITGILNRGGKVLMPVFALGRAQELLLILEDYWQRHPDLQKIPIYYTGNTARKCMVVYQTYINAMNDNIKRIFRERMAEAEASGNARGVSAGPWDFRFVRSLRNLDRFDDMGGCVMLASPGMLQSGMSRILLERWAPDQRNGVVMTGYNVEGTMARTVLSEPDTIPAIMSGGGSGGGQTMGKRTRDGEDQAVTIPRRCSVEEFQFAAHVTGVENVEFIGEIAAPHVILVHGERSQAARLRSRLLDLNNRKAAASGGEAAKVYSPENGATIRIAFRKDKVAKVVGRLAQIPPPKSTDPNESRVMSGVLVQNGFKLSLMAAEDLREYAGLTTTTVMCKQHITLSAAGMDLITWALESTFGAIEEIGRTKTESNDKGKQANGVNEMDTDTDTEMNKEEEVDEEIPTEPSRSFLIMGCVTLKWSGREKQIELEWEGNTMNDGIADAIMAVLMTVESSPAAVKYSSNKQPHSHHHHGNGNGNGGGTREGKDRNQLADSSPEERFARLCMFLEEQFGDGVAPIEKPRLTSNTDSKAEIQSKAESVKDEDSSSSDSDEDSDEDDLEVREAAECARLAALGIPVPGLEIKVDKLVARLWLENLDVECANTILRDRVRAVVERAVETVAPLWTVKGMARR